MIIGTMIRVVKSIICPNAQLIDDFELPLYMSLCVCMGLSVYVYVYNAMCQRLIILISTANYRIKNMQRTVCKNTRTVLYYAVLYSACLNCQRSVQIK